MSKISEERKTAYYAGMGLTAVGFILFISTFFTFGSSDPFTTSPQSLIAKPVIGMVLMISGGFIKNIGAKGAAGSGVILDPDKAAEDLKPFNEAKGKMINDVVGNIDIVKNYNKENNVKEVVRIKCRVCGSLNEEDAKFCKNCGKTL